MSDEIEDCERTYAELERHAAAGWARVAELEAESAARRKRAEAAEDQVVRVREALEILERNSTGTPASGEEANRWDGIQEAIADVEAALEPTSNLPDHLSVQVEATSGVAGSPATSTGPDPRIAPSADRRPACGKCACGGFYADARTGGQSCGLCGHLETSHIRPTAGTVGVRLSGAMYDRQVPVDVLARSAGVGADLILSFLDGSRVPSVSDLDRIAAGLDVPAGWPLEVGPIEVPNSQAALRIARGAGSGEDR